MSYLWESRWAEAFEENEVPERVLQFRSRNTGRCATDSNSRKAIAVLCGNEQGLKEATILLSEKCGNPQNEPSGDALGRRENLPGVTPKAERYRRPAIQ